MASIKLQYNFGDAKPATPFAFSPPKGFRWKIKGAHAAITASATAGARTAGIFIAQDTNGPHGQLVCLSTGAVSTLSVAEGGISSAGFFAATAIEQNYTPWNAALEVETNASLVFFYNLQAGDTVEYRVHIEEVPA